MSDAPRILLIGGLEPSGMAGLLADVAAVNACGGKPLACASALTAQPEGGAVFVSPAPVEALQAQIAACVAAGPVAAVKLGMLARPEGAAAVVEALLRLPPVPVVVDPVLASSTEAPLFSGGSRRAAYRELARLRPIFTPNFVELGILSGFAPAPDDDAELVQVRELLAWGAAAVLVKGGHRPGFGEVTDVLTDAEGLTRRFAAPRLAGGARGTGCRLASAMASFLAQGEPLGRAVERARAYVRGYISA